MNKWPGSNKISYSLWDYGTNIVPLDLDDLVNAKQICFQHYQITAGQLQRSGIRNEVLGYSKHKNQNDHFSKIDYDRER